MEAYDVVGWATLLIAGAALGVTIAILHYQKRLSRTNLHIELIEQRYGFQTVIAGNKSTEPERYEKRTAVSIYFRISNRSHSRPNRLVELHIKAPRDTEDVSNFRFRNFGKHMTWDATRRILHGAMDTGHIQGLLVGEPWLEASRTSSSRAIWPCRSMDSTSIGSNGFRRLPQMRSEASHNTTRASRTVSS